MDQATRLKWAAVAFTIFWIGGMLWWSGDFHPAHIIILAVCGTVGGYLWYLAMRWIFQCMHLMHASIEWGSRCGPGNAAMTRVLGWALLMLFTGLATAWLRGVVDPLLPAGDWHGMLSGLFVVVTWPSLT
jgi:peptidoglycan biosynthesis protein MviN/MurJ (putative lipid II flippase)